MTARKPRPSRAQTVIPPTTLPDLALGAWEAAAICGVHFTRIKRMAASGLLIYRPMDSAWSSSDEPQNEFLIYSLHDCDENYREYIAKLSEGGTGRRPRNQESLDLHDEVIAALKGVEPITYDDAISTAQAAAIMGTHVTWVNTLIRDGKLKARVAMSLRHGKGKSRIYIVSRRSCEKNRAAAMAAEKTGRKAGPRRKKPAGVVPKVTARRPNS